MRATNPKGREGRNNGCRCCRAEANRVSSAFNVKPKLLRTWICVEEDYHKPALGLRTAAGLNTDTADRCRKPNVVEPFGETKLERGPCVVEEDFYLHAL